MGSGTLLVRKSYCPEAEPQLVYKAHLSTIARGYRIEKRKKKKKAKVVIVQGYSQDMVHRHPNPTHNDLYIGV